MVTKTCGSVDSLIAAYKRSDVIGYPDEAFDAINVAPLFVEQVDQPCVLRNSETPVIVAVSGTKLSEAPTFQVVLDGISLGEAAVDAALDNSEASAPEERILASQTLFRFIVPLGDNARWLGLEFLNDRWGGEGHPGDTNLWVKYLRVGDRIFSGTI